MPRLMHVHARLIEAFDLLPDAPRRLLDEGLSLHIDRGEIDQVALGVSGIPGSNGLHDLCDGNGNRLSRNPRFELHNRSLFVRAETGHMEDAIFMGFLALLE